eukprot:3595836-Pyramimonas_sp.AAC.3
MKPCIKCRRSIHFHTVGLYNGEYARIELEVLDDVSRRNEDSEDQLRIIPEHISLFLGRLRGCGWRRSRGYCRRACLSVGISVSRKQGSGGGPHGDFLRFGWGHATVHFGKLLSATNTYITIAMLTYQSKWPEPNLTRIATDPHARGILASPICEQAYGTGRLFNDGFSSSGCYGEYMYCSG